MPNAAVDKGKRAEAAVAKYCRDNDMAGAERSVSTGWRNGSRELADSGDIKGIPLVAIQVKDRTKSGPLVDKTLYETMAATQVQADAAGAVVALLVEKRAGYASPGKWWAWLWSDVYAALLSGQAPPLCRRAEVHPVRVELRHIIGRIAELSNRSTTVRSMSK